MGNVVENEKGQFKYIVYQINSHYKKS